MSRIVPFRRRFMTPMFDDFQSIAGSMFRDSEGFSIDIQDAETEYVVEAEMPGMSKDNIDIGLKEGYLRISAKKSESTEDEKPNYIHKERREFSTSRQVYLPDVTNDGVHAKLEDGILTIKIPKQKQNGTNKIPIE